MSVLLRASAAVVLTAAALAPSAATPVLSRGAGAASIAYAQWARLSPARRLDTVNAAIEAVRYGWIWGYGQGRNDVINALLDPNVLNASIGSAVAQAAAHKITDPPSYSKSPRSYVTALNEYYHRYPRARAQSIFVPLLLCMADHARDTCDSVARRRLH